MRALQSLFCFLLTLHTPLASASWYSRSSFPQAPAAAGSRVLINPLVNCPSLLSSGSDLEIISVTDPVQDSIAITKLLNFKLNSTQLSLFTRVAQAAFEISHANSGNVSISANTKSGKAEPTVVIRIDLQPDELEGIYRLRYSSSQGQINSQLMIPRIEIRIEPERIVIFKASAPAEKVGSTLLATERTSHGIAFSVAYGSKVPVIDSGIVSSQMAFRSETLFGRHCLEIAKVAGLNLSSDGLVYLRTSDAMYILSGDGWMPFD